MISSDVIASIYKQYPKRPNSVDELDFASLFDKAGMNHDIMVDPETEELIIGSISPKSPFHKIPLKNIHAFVPFENWVAIVLHSTIIFLSAKDNKVSVHLKAEKPSIWNRLFQSVMY